MLNEMADSDDDDEELDNVLELRKIKTIKK